MRTQQDLIAELDAAAPNFFLCWIAVGFEASTIFVSASDPDREEHLVDAMQKGGEPIGLVGFYQQKADVGDGAIGGFFTRPFAEYADEEWAKKYLEDLRNEVAKGLPGQQLPPPVFG
jgi:hypothetical protein